MTVVRGLYLLVFFGVLAIVVIEMRTEQARVAANVESLQRRRVALRREAWTLQMEISQLRAPHRISERIAYWSLELNEPRPPSESSAAERMLAVR